MLPSCTAKSARGDGEIGRRLADLDFLKVVLIERLPGGGDRSKEAKEAEDGNFTGKMAGQDGGQHEKNRR